MTSAIGSIVYVWRKKGWPLREVVAMWIRAGRSPDLGKIDWLHNEGRTQADEFWATSARREYDEATNWYCVYGCCVVIWGSGKRGNMGGHGPAGCPCDDLDEPRNLARGPIPERTDEGKE